jgi:hypothetical protein
MLRRLIAFCLLRRPLVLIAYGAFLGLGFVAFAALNIEAYPDPAPPHHRDHRAAARAVAGGDGHDLHLA